MTRVRLTRRGGETQLKACGLIGKQSELCRARRHRERSLSGGETCFSVRRSAALRPALLLPLLHRLHPALTQRAHYDQCRALDPRRHSYEACLKPLRRAHSPQCEWLGTYHKQDGWPLNMAARHEEAQIQFAFGQTQIWSFCISVRATFALVHLHHALAAYTQMHHDTWQPSYAICRKYISVFI